MKFQFKYFDRKNIIYFKKSNIINIQFLNGYAWDILFIFSQTLSSNKY